MTYPHPTGPWPARPGPWTPAPMDPAHRQAAVRYEARAKKPIAAWILWILGPFMLHVHVHDFYLGAVGRGLVKLILAGIAWAGAITAYAMLMVTYEEGFDTREPGSVGDAAITEPGPVLWAALIVMALTGLVTVIWWIVDGVGMSRRLERLDAQLRQELSRDHGVDPWSF
ncbi:TM2 domain-containing protein [Kocuria palustris]|uniref:TM2 domain-containing protein n=1 Tax=Kocuria palustris TaxID=71999 RepID=UPI0021A58C28|nr:TM2 domain-containing protein [Kocuria palustris]MCT1591409.1 TM2 domain-containing protein [Kocuria palustris]